MENLWTPLFSFAIFALAFGVGDIISNKTKAILSSVLVGCTVYLIGFLTGVIPTDSVDTTGLTTVMGAFGLMLMCVNVGTLMNLEELIREWKTVVIAMAGMVGLAAFALTVGSLIFGREWALLGSCPISGGIVAMAIAADEANAVGRGDLAAYVTLLCSLQVFAGMPVAAFMLRKEARRLLNSGSLEQGSSVATVEKKINIKLIKSWPDSTQSATFTMAKLAVVAVVSMWLANLTIVDGSQVINQYILCMILGVLFTELGFLEKSSLQKANANGFLSAALMSILIGNFKSIDIPSLLSMIWPVVGMLLLSTVAIVVVAALVGKVLHISFPMSAAISVCCMLGYPCTQIVTEETLVSMGLDPETADWLRPQLLPKMLVGGFTTTVTVSVLFAAIIAPMAF